MPEETQPIETQTTRAAPRTRQSVGEAERARILLEVTSAVVSTLSLRDLLLTVSHCLRQFFNHDFASMLLYEEEAGMLRVHALDALARDGFLGEGALLPLEGTPPGLAITTRTTVLRHRLDLEEFNSPMMREAYNTGVRSGCSVPLISHNRVLGSINVGSLREAAFTESDAELLSQIAGQVAIAVENVLNFERATKEGARVRTLLEVNNAIATNLNIRDLLRATSGCLHAYFRHDFAALTLYNEETDSLHVHAFDRARPDTDIYEGEPVPVEGTLTGLAFSTRRAVYRSPIDVEETHAPMARRFFEQQGLQSFCCVPLISHGHVVGVLTLGSRQQDSLTAEDVELLERIGGQVALGVENTINYERAAKERARVQTLLEVNNVVATHLNLHDLLRATSTSLRACFKQDFAGLALYDETIGQLRVHALDLSRPDTYLYEGSPLSLDTTLNGICFTTRQPVVRGRIDESETSWPIARTFYQQQGLKSFCCVPLISRERAIGVLSLGSRQEGAMADEDVEMFRRIADQVAIAVENTLSFEREAKERERAQLLLEINNAVATILDIQDLFHAISACLRKYFKHDFAGVALYDEPSGQLRVHALDYSQPPDAYVEEGFLMPLDETPAGRAYTSRQSVLIRRLDAAEFPSLVVERAIAAGYKSSCNAPLIARDLALGSVVVASKNEAAFSEADADFLSHIACQLALAVENAIQYQQIEQLKNKLASEKLYLEEEIKAEYNFAEIVGQSRALKNVLDQLKTVAPTDSVVLICGETGTGKELIARAVHDLSGRRERTMVKVNCAAIPTGLLESEFFGHEKGAFTGAVSQRAGRFELANKGTLFLDEVGEIPLELQPKLLRVLQEQEFERLGGSRTIRVDVRLIAATNCNLREMVSEKKFRSDLFYRLNVFPIYLPPLRERPEDIPLLAGYFTQKHSRRMNKRIDAIPSETVEALCRNHWPGNVRELENFIERAVILTRGHELQAPLAELEAPVHATEKGSQPAVPAELLSLADAERAHIEDVLRHTKGVVGGKGGAAEILDMPISTLRGRMKKLGLM